MRVRVLYLGMLKDIVGRDKEELQVPENSRVGDLFAELERRVPKLSDFRSAIALAVNYEYSDAATVLQERDEVALLPPVSGGLPEQSVLPLASAHARLQREPIDPEPLLSGIKDGEDGAVCMFDGIVRNHSRNRRTLYLEYESYPAMAVAGMEKLAVDALAGFPVRDVRIVHRVGRLEIGETSVLIAVASAHRAAAFEACRWMIDTLKKTVPVWKKEFFDDGATWADGEPFPPDLSL